MKRRSKLNDNGTKLIVGKKEEFIDEILNDKKIMFKT